MKKLLCILVSAVLAMAAAVVSAHHSVPAEFGDSARPTEYVEGKILDVRWLNPHVFIDLELTSGEFGNPGEKWRLTTHPIEILRDYGIEKTDFAVGDTVQIHAWTHIRGMPLLHPRAMQVNDGPMRSFLTFADFRDIASGAMKEKGITPAPHLEQTRPGRAGGETVAALEEMGLIGEDGYPKFPEGFFDYE